MSDLSNAIWNIIQHKDLPPDNVIQVIQLYLKNDRVVESPLLMEHIIIFYLQQDRIDVWDLIGTLYLSLSRPKEVDQNYIESFQMHFKEKVKTMIEQKISNKKLHSQINF